MNTFQLECFLAVANSLSFATAAKQMNVSQPAVTHQIKSLEDEVGSKLFYRSTRSVRLTADGEAFITDAKSILAIEKQAKLRFRSSEKPIEKLSVGCANHIQLGMLSNALSEIKSEIPKLYPHLMVAPYEQLFQFLGTEHLDLIFGVYDSNSVMTGTKYKELLQSELVCICKCDHPISGKKIIKRSDLLNEELIFCDPMSLAPEISKYQLSIAEGKRPSDIHFCSSSSASYVLARAGYGTAFLPDLLIPSDPYVIKIPIENAPKLSFGMFYKPSSSDSIVKRFILIASECFNDNNRLPF